MSEQTRVERIVEIEKAAAEAVTIIEDMTATVDDLRWEAAELIHGELAEGKSHRQLGKEIGKSHTHVRVMAEVWERYGNQVSTWKGRFNKLYKKVMYSKPEPPQSSASPAAPKITPKTTPKLTVVEKATEKKLCTIVVAYDRFRDICDKVPGDPEDFGAMASWAEAVRASLDEMVVMIRHHHEPGYCSGAS